MSTRRFLFTFGACLAAAMLLVPATATAQADSTAATARPAANLNVGSIRVIPYQDRFDRLRVRWTNSTTAIPDAQGPITGFRIFWKRINPIPPNTSVGGANDMPANNLLAYKYVNCSVGTSAARAVSGAASATNWCDVPGLVANGHYGIRVAPYNAFGVGEAAAFGSGWVTGAPNPGRVAGTGPPNYLCTIAGSCVETMPGDKLLRVKWAAPVASVTAGLGSGLTISSYTARWRTSETNAKPAGGWSTLTGIKGTSVILANLTNGQMYDVEVHATNSAGVNGAYSITVRGTPMMPTPALPVFGALALGAGLVAAGRRRLRRRQASLRG